MKSKNFLTKLRHLSTQIPLHLEVEKKLLPRLKFMGFVLLALSCGIFIFALFSPQHSSDPIAQLQPIELSSGPTLLDDNDSAELDPNDIFNFYVISTIFAGLGVTLLLTTKKKRKAISHTETPTSTEHASKYGLDRD